MRRFSWNATTTSDDDRTTMPASITMKTRWIGTLRNNGSDQEMASIPGEIMPGRKAPQTPSNAISTDLDHRRPGDDELRATDAGVTAAKKRALTSGRHQRLIGRCSLDQLHFASLDEPPGTPSASSSSNSIDKDSYIQRDLSAIT
jgi:hypothetical protein